MLWRAAALVQMLNRGAAAEWLASYIKVDYIGISSCFRDNESESGALYSDCCCYNIIFFFFIRLSSCVRVNYFIGYYASYTYTISK